MLDTLSFDVELADAGELVSGEWGRGWTIPPKLSVSRYADDHRHIAKGAGAEPGKWRTGRNPPQREIMDALSEHSPVQVLDFMKPAQWGATEIGINWVSYVIHLGLDSMVVAQPVKDLARSWSADKFGPAVDLMPELAVRIDVDNTFEKKFLGGTLWAIWVNSAKQLRQRSARYIFADEVDEYPANLGGQGGADEQLEARALSYGGRAKIYRACTPTVDGASNIQAGFEGGDQRRYRVPCPHCGVHQVLEEERLAPDGSYFACSANGCTIEEHHKTAMLRERSPCSGCGEVPLRVIHSVSGDGTYVYADECECGVTVDPPAPDGAYWEPANPGVPRTRRSYHIWAAYTPVGLGLSWPEIAARRAIAERSPDKRVTYTNLILAQPYKGDRKQQDADEVRTLAEPGVHLGVVPMGGLLLFAGVDFQHDRAEIQVVAKGRGQRTRVVDYAVVDCDPTRIDRYGDVDTYLRGTWLNSRGIQMHLTAVALDGGNWTETVAQFVKSKVGYSGAARMLQVDGVYRKQTLYLVRGRSEKKSDRAVYRPRKTEVNERDKTLARSVGVWGVGTSVLKHLLYGWMSGALTAKQEAERAGEPEDIEARMIRWPGGRGDPHDPLHPDPGALPPEYWAGLTCEYFDTAAGAWITPRGARNEPLDTLLYAEWAALAPAAKVDTMREPQWAALEATYEPPEDLFTPRAAGQAAGPQQTPVPAVPAAQESADETLGSDTWSERW